MEEKKVCPGCCHKTKDRPEKEYKDLMNRLSRIEGQVRGVRRMVEEGAYCPDILVSTKCFWQTISGHVWQMISGMEKMKRLTSS